VGTPRASVGAYGDFSDYREATARIEQFNQRRQAAHDFRVEKELELAQREAWGQFQETLAERGEEDKWVEQWERHLGAALKPYQTGGAGLRGVSREAREALEFKRRAFELDKRQAVQQQATARGVAVATKVGLDSVNASWDSGDEVGAINGLGELVSKRLLDEKLVPQMIEEGKARMQVQEVMGLLNTDPIGALERIKERGEDGKPVHFDRLSEEQRYTLENHANRRASELRQKTYQDLAERMQGGEVLGDKELAELVERKILKATDAQRIKKQRAAGGMKPESIEFMELFHRARAYDAARDTTMQVADAIMAESLGMADFERKWRRRGLFASRWRK